MKKQEEKIIIIVMYTHTNTDKKHFFLHQRWAVNYWTSCAPQPDIHQNRKQKKIFTQIFFAAQEKLV
jgi:hypothetical protein